MNSRKQRIGRARTGPLAEATLVFCPLKGLYMGPNIYYFYLEGFPPGVPTGTNTKGTSPEGHFCASLNNGRLKMPRWGTAIFQRNRFVISSFKCTLKVSV